jgi:hypothetical protein
MTCAPALPIPAEELALRLSRSLAPERNNLELSVTEVALLSDPDADLKLQLLVKVTSLDSPKAQVWQVGIPIDPTDLDPAVNLSAFILIVRANLEEWWAVKTAEPRIAAWGRRLR